jgi:hypothetical protein
VDDESVTGRAPARLTVSQGSIVAVCVVLGFFVLPASGAVLDPVLGPVRAQDASWIGLPVWAAGFLLGGAIAGHQIAGRRGRLPFSIAFLVFPVAAAMVIGQSLTFHDNYRWRPHEHALDLALFDVAYPLTFAAMAWLSTALLTHDQKIAGAAAAACSLNGVVGGVIFSLAITLLPLRGRIEAIAFVASLALPAFLSARRLSVILKQTAIGRQ